MNKHLAFVELHRSTLARALNQSQCGRRWSGWRWKSLFSPQGGSDPATSGRVTQLSWTCSSGNLEPCGTPRTLGCAGRRAGFTCCWRLRRTVCADSLTPLSTGLLLWAKQGLRLRSPQTRTSAYTHAWQGREESPGRPGYDGFFQIIKLF